MTDDTGKGDATSPATTTQTSSATDDTATHGATPAGTDDKGNAGELGEPGRRALDAERERVKQLERRLAELEDAGKSELERERSQREREAKRAEEAETEIAALKRDISRRSIAVEVGLAPELADRIQGDDERAMRADAKRLLDLTNPDGLTTAGRGGVSSTRGSTDMNALIREASGRG